MGTTKSEIFSADQNRLAQLAKAIGHPARVAIIEHLLRVNSCICKDIVEEIGLAQPTISQHLKELKNVGLIKGNIDGNAICYCLDAGAFEQISSYFGHIANQLGTKSTCC